MDKKILAIVAAAGGIVLGVAGARMFAPATANIVCPTRDGAVDAKADAIARQLHAHDHDAYVPQATTPIGELPKPAKDDASRSTAH